MVMQEMIRANGFRRTMSSGMTFDGKLSINNESDKTFPLNRILFCLIDEEMELSFRSQNCLKKAGIKLIGQLVQKSQSELLDLNNFGRTSLREIEKALHEIDLTLEMTLNFPPWNGDGDGNELIHILSLQEPGGGFYIDDNAAKALGINLKELNQKPQVKNSEKNREKPSIPHTRYLLDRLESKFEKEMPFFTSLVKQHQKWLEKVTK